MVQFHMKSHGNVRIYTYSWIIKNQWIKELGKLVYHVKCRQQCIVPSFVLPNCEEQILNSFHILQFEHALMIFHRGFRLRTKLYSQDFQQGILKATSIILNSIKTLDDYTEGPQPEKMIPNGKNVSLIRFKNYNIFRNPYSF